MIRALAFWFAVAMLAGSAGAINVRRQTATLAFLIRSQHPGACVEESPLLWACGSKLKLEGLHDLDILGEGLHVQFTDADAGKGGIQIIKASRVSLSNFTISWRNSILAPSDPPTAKPIFSMGHVSSCSSGGLLKLDVVITGRLPVDVVSVWDANRGWPWSFNGPPSIDISFKTGNMVAFKGGFSPCLQELAPVVGQDVVVRHRQMTNHAWQCVECTDFRLLSAQVLSAPGMAFVFEGGFNLALVDSKVRPSCSPVCPAPTPSVTADAAHFSDSAGNIDISGNDFSFQGDDGINVSSLLLRATLEPANFGASPVQRWSAVSVESRFPLTFFSIGDEVTAFSRNLAKIGSGRILAKDEKNLRMLLDFAPLDADFLLSTNNRSAKRILIENNYLHDNRARGILLTNDNATIRQNRIERVTMNAILLAGDGFYFYEGPGAKNVHISENQVKDTNFASPRKRFPSPVDVGTITPNGDIAVNGVFVNICISRNNISQQRSDLSPTQINPYPCLSR